jgi:hypothetical protein
LALVLVGLNFSFLLPGMSLELRLGTRQLILPSKVKEKLLQIALHLTQYHQTIRDRHLSDHSALILLLLSLLLSLPRDQIARQKDHH